MPIWARACRAKGDRQLIEGASVFAVVVVAFVGITVLMGVRQVPQGFNYTVERFGKYYKTLTPGLGLIYACYAAQGRRFIVAAFERLDASDSDYRSKAARRSSPGCRKPTSASGLPPSREAKTGIFSLPNSQDRRCLGITNLFLCRVCGERYRRGVGAVCTLLPDR
jgi:hypothetical protein